MKKMNKTRRRKYKKVDVARAFIIVAIDLIIAFGLSFCILVYLFFQLNLIFEAL